MTRNNDLVRIGKEAGMARFKIFIWSLVNNISKLLVTIHALKEQRSCGPFDMLALADRPQLNSQNLLTNLLRQSFFEDKAVGA